MTFRIIKTPEQGPDIYGTPHTQNFDNEVGYHGAYTEVAMVVAAADELAADEVHMSHTTSLALSISNWFLFWVCYGFGVRIVGIEPR